MNDLPGLPCIVTDIKADLSFKELTQKIQMSGTNPAILKVADTVFKKVNGNWHPALVYRWVKLDPTKDAKTARLCAENLPVVKITPGHSKRFLNKAEHAIVAVYTAGKELDEAATQANKDKDYLAGHFLDLIGLLVLEKTEQIVKEIAEKKAVENNWGVSPFLSPGSVHGWELMEQTTLAKVLPIKDIGVTISETGVFTPFKTISCLIGIGPAYKTNKVGTTCEVCSKKDSCQMSQNLNTD
ncbi:MAG: hypothetical protein MI892_26040 [Desulfobacterales bacterium]|nr:hypothetical protein [Desulfobacterales bacterium]